MTTELRPESDSEAARVVMCAPVEAENVPAPHGVQTAAPAGRERSEGAAGGQTSPRATERGKRKRDRDGEREIERQRERERHGDSV